jgi:DNA-binding NarL/FixJ family response regulator
MDSVNGTLNGAASDHKERIWVWLRCDYPVVASGLSTVLEGVAEVRFEGPNEAEEGLTPYCTVVCCDDGKNLTEKIKNTRETAPEAPVVVVGLLNEAKRAKTALRSGASGFLHVGMTPSQIRRAVCLAGEGETVIPRDLVADLIKEEEVVDPLVLTPRQREILDIVADGLTNAQIAERLFLSEYTIKQHLRAAYKLLGARNRVEAARIFRRSQGTA